MTRNNLILIFVVVILLIAFGVFMSSPKYQYTGSNYYGGGNIEQQLAFIGGYKTYASTPY